MDNHLPVLQVVLPLVAAPVCVIVRQCRLSWVIALVVCATAFAISFSLFKQVNVNGPISYAIGGWVGHWGIEYYIDKLTAFMLLLINGVGALILLGSRASLEKEIASDRLYLFYAAFLLNLTGLLGVIITGDAFNLFVFI